MATADQMREAIWSLRNTASGAESLLRTRVFASGEPVTDAEAARYATLASAHRAVAAMLAAMVAERQDRAA